MKNDWGEALCDDGSVVPLVAPAFDIPEDEREYIETGNPGLVLWTKRT